MTRLIDKIFSDLKFKTVYSFFDDLVVYTDGPFSQHLNHLKEVLKRLQSAGLTINPQKITVASNHIEFLGFIFKNGTVSYSHSKIDPILNFPTPKNPKQVARLIGMTAYYARFIPNYSQLTAPLNHLKKKDVKFQWGTAQQEAFEKIKKVLSSHPVLRLPDWDRPFFLQTGKKDLEDLENKRENMLNFFNVYKNVKINKPELAPQAYNAYKVSKNTYRSHLVQAKKQAYENYIETAPNSCKAAWEIINHENRSCEPQEVTLDPEVINNFCLNSVKNISNNFPVTSTSVSEFLGSSFMPSNSFQWQAVKSSDIIRAVNKLSNSKTMDFFGLSNKVIKLTIEYIQEPLAFIFSKCLELGYFADSLKISKVIPVFKNGDKQLPQNYRPISIVLIFSKIFESIMYEQLSFYFEYFNLTSESQFGFRPGRSTTNAVMKIVDHTLRAFDNKESVALSLLDLSKAFDCIPFSFILQKLKFYGISSDACRIITSYLENRQQYVSVKGLSSSVQKVSIGVPQGSILGPFFFSIIINDLPKNLSVNSVIYADDTTLFASSRNTQELNTIINNAQLEARNWFSTNKLLCNSDKTQNTFLSLTTNQTGSVKLLGMWIDTKLSWSVHIDSICKRISRVSFLLWKLRDLISMEYLKTCYYGLFQSHISYGLILWGHSSAVHRILLIQKKVLRTICRATSQEHCRPLFIHTRILTIINLYIYHVLSFTKNNLHLLSTRQAGHSFTFYKKQRQIGPS